MAPQAGDGRRLFMRYVLSGYYGFGNAGDDAILSAVVHGLREHDPDAVITVIGPPTRRFVADVDDESGEVAESLVEAVGAADLFDALGVEVIPRDHWWRVMAALRRSDLLISGGGGLLQDVTSTRSLQYYLSHLMAARVLKRRRMVYAQGVGPLQDPTSRWWVRAALGGAVITVRDDESAELLARCGIKPETIQVTADPVFSWASRPSTSGVPTSRVSESDLPNRLAIIWRSFPASHVGLRLLRPEIDAWARHRGLEPIFCVFQPTRDVMELRKAGVPRESIVTFEEPHRWIETLAECRLALSVRYHGIVFSALAGVPALGIAYDPKVEAVCRQLGLPEPIPADSLDMDELLVGLERLLQQADGWRAELAPRLARLNEGARRTAELAVEVAKGEAEAPVAAGGEVAVTELSPSAPGHPRRADYAEVLGVPVHPVDLDGAVTRIMDWVFSPEVPHTSKEPGWRSGREGGRRGRLVVTANPELIMRAEADPALRHALRGAALVVPDGVGVVWAARRLGHPLPGRVPGIELAEAVMAEGASRGMRVFLCGSRPGVAPRAARRLRQRFPGLEIVGAAHGYFQGDEEGEVIERIASSGADVLFLGLGAPKQELWLTEHMEQLGVKVAMGIGGALDVWSGRVARAPGLMRRIGMEWLWRIVRQPKRLARAGALPRFALHVWRQRR